MLVLLKQFLDAFQNGIYRAAEVDKSLGESIKAATMVLYMTEVDEVVYTETPEYGIEEEVLNFLNSYSTVSLKWFTTKFNRTFYLMSAEQRA